MSKVTLTDKGSHFEVVMNHPPGNNMTLGVMEKLAAYAFEAGAKQNGTKTKPVIILSALPGVFSMGIDPSEVLDRKQKDRAKMFEGLAEVVRAFHACGAPIICDVNGAAIAGGAVLAFLGTFLVVGAAAKVSFSEVKVGLPLPEFVQLLISQRLTSGASREAMFLGKNFTAGELVQHGATTLAYLDETHHGEVMSGLVGRISRVHPDVMAETLKVHGRVMLKGLKRFHEGIEGFIKFLGDDFLGRSLSELLNGPK